MIVHVHVFTAKITNVFSAQNIFLRCPAETSGQNNINQQIVNLSWKKGSLMNPHYAQLKLMRYLLGHDCSWLIIYLAVWGYCTNFLCYLIRQCVQSKAICPDKELKCTENGQLLDIISDAVSNVR